MFLLLLCMILCQSPFGCKKKWIIIVSCSRVKRYIARFIRFTASAFRKLPSIYVFSYFPFGFEGRMWDLIVSVPDHCLFFYLKKKKKKNVNRKTWACCRHTYMTFVEKNNIWTATWQNQQNECAPSEDSDQPGHPPSLICRHCALNAQADLSFRWPHTHFVGFVMSWLLYTGKYLRNKQM